MKVHTSHYAQMRKVALWTALLVVGCLASVGAVSVYGTHVIASYLPLHTMLETLTVVVASLIFSVGWNSYRRELPSNVLVIACAFFGVGVLDFSHMLSYTGMPDFVTPSGPQKAIYFWLAARLLAALSLFSITVTRWHPLTNALSRYFFITPVLVGLAFVHWLFLFHGSVLPIVFIAGQGLTTFKIHFEYFIIFINISTAVILLKRMERPAPYNASGLFGAVCAMAISEFFFTRYVDFADIFNLLGHIYKVVSYLFLYFAIFVETIEHPYNQLQVSQNQMKAILDAMPEILLEVGHDGCVYSSHVAPSGLLTIPINQLIGDLFPQAAVETFRAVVDEAVKTGTSHGKQVELPLPQGSRWYAVSAAREIVPTQMETRFIVLMHDVTDQKGAEEELRIAATAFESQEGIMIADANYQIVRVNHAFTSITGYDSGEVLGKNPHILCSDCHGQDFYDAIWESIHKTGTWDGEIWNRRKNGDIYPAHLIITAVRDSKTEITHYVSSLTDISLRKQYESELATRQRDLERLVAERTQSLVDEIQRRKQSEETTKKAQTQAMHTSKLASVGQLAAGIAHEINSPVQYVGDNLRYIGESLGTLTAALQKAEDLMGSTDTALSQEFARQVDLENLDLLRADLSTAVQESLEGVNQIGRIVLSMKEFSHPGTSSKTMVDINHALENTLMVSRNAWKHVAQIDKQFDPSLPSMLCQAGEMNQVFLNLIVNAAQAIETSGKALPGNITITTSHDPGQITIRVSDSGTGVPVAIRDKIFDPFFTTKDVGKGTGQGLAICYDVIVTKHGGTIDVAGNVGEGAVFTVRLPIEPEVDAIPAA